MNRLHTSILALVMSIFLIQASDPPYEKPTGSFIKFFPLKIPALIYTPFVTNVHKTLSTELQPPTLDPQELHPSTLDPQELHPPTLSPQDYQSSQADDLFKDPTMPHVAVYSTLQDFPRDNFNSGSNLPSYPSVDAYPLSNRTQFDGDVPENSSSSNNTNGLTKLHNYLVQINDESQTNKEKTAYQELLEQDFVRPLLKLYEKEIHQDSDYLTNTNNRISKENNVEITANKTKEIALIRRYDSNIDDTKDKEHIGEILPADFHKNRKRVFFARKLNPVGFKPSLERSEIIRFPMAFPSGASSEGSDVFVTENVNRINEQYYSRSPRLGIPILEQFRMPRRYRGFREGYSDGQQVHFDPSARYQTVWSSRRPRVIFPTEQVTFRDPIKSQDAEPDWLAGDGTLQDLQEQDIRDRGSDKVVCAPGASCQFFLTCWLSGGLLDQPCDGLLRGCCYRGRVAKSGGSGFLAIGTLDAPPDTSKNNIGYHNSDFRCGISLPQAQRRIVGGEEAGFGTFPWQAYIRIGSSRCGGSLVSRRHVVTAGHCVARAIPKQVHVTLGDYVINSAVESLPAYTFGVSHIQIHPLFKFTPQADRFDVAVLLLDRAAHNLPHITPICLPPRGENFLGEIGVAAGWGALSPGSRLRPQTLQAVQVPVIENKQCERWHRSKGIAVTIHDEMLCAGYKNGGRDSCQGDSGGPLMLQKTGRWFLIGIVSAGYSCAQSGQPGIYHRVAHTVDWIIRAIGNTN
ncbi:uncharacterized protein LOC130447897 [Diorhabda sublineata]|uniref:uncharacterized protein LOC130447897 n=1 Tax=Diorhabda sublineata TaxID=1163346 RepID=UPI0024E15B22|nr:uncharacterized protein LOC130447897 [Diorhabda sublineata]